LTLVVYAGGAYEKKSDGSMTKYYAAGGAKVVRQVPPGAGAGTLSWLLADHLGTAVGALDGAGALVATQRYWPYGAVRSGGVTQTDKLYTGQQAEPGDALGLYNYKARFYSTTLGRFVSADVVADGLNRYTYVQSNPLGFADPTGHCFESISGEELKDCNAEAAESWFRCALGACSGALGEFARQGISQNLFWDNVWKIHYSEEIFPELTWVLVTGPVSQDRFSLVSGYGWDTLGAFSGVSGRFFRLSIYDLVNGTSNISTNLSDQDLIGAYEWWSDSFLMGAIWTSRFGQQLSYEGHASDEIFWVSFKMIDRMLRQGVNVSAILGWSPDQVSMLIGLSVDLPKGRGFDSRQYANNVIGCLKQQGVNCPGLYGGGLRALEWLTRNLRRLRY